MRVFLSHADIDSSRARQPPCRTPARPTWSDDRDDDRRRHDHRDARQDDTTDRRGRRHARPPSRRPVPTLTSVELAHLTDDIRVNGVRVPVVVTADGRLLDGRNRVAAAVLAGLDEMPVVEHGGDTDPYTVVVSHNVHRRHLTVGQRAAIAVELEPRYAEQARQRMLSGKSSNPEPDPAQGPTHPRAPQARDLAAKAVGTSGQRMSDYKKLEAEAPDLSARVAAGELPLDRASRICRDRLSAQRQATTSTATPAGSTRCEVRHGSLFDEQMFADLEPGSVAAIIADPLWSRKGIEMASGIAALARRLKPRSLAVQVGVCFLPQMVAALGSCGLPYRWCLSVVSTSSGGTSVLGRAVTSHHTVVLVYGAGGKHLPTDVLNPSAAKDPAHPLAQDVSVYETLVGALTEPGERLLDPCCGSGTTLLAARNLGRCSIGVDVDVDAGMVELARRRLGLPTG